MADPDPDHRLTEEMRLLSDALAGMRAGDQDVGPDPRPDQPGLAPRTASTGSEEGGSARGCPTCGCGAPGVCAACPLCRAAGLVAALRPDALSRLADVAALAADLLRAAAEGTTRTHAPGEVSRPSVEEIPVIRDRGEEPGDTLEEGSTP